jgi:two-component system, NarL family, response regulator LiaR
MINPIRSSISDEVQKCEKIRVMLVDDHSLMRDSLRTHLESEGDIEVIAEVANGEEAIELATKLTPHVIIMDIAMPKMNGLEATRQIKLLKPDIAVLVLTVHNDTEYILKILEVGADGYLTKDVEGDKLASAIRLVVSGGSVLSDNAMNKLLKHALRYPAKPSVSSEKTILSSREMEILRLSSKGMSNKQIALELKLNLRTVKSHFFNIFSKLHVNSRTVAVIVGLKTGLITSDDIGFDI